MTLTGRFGQASGLAFTTWPASVGAGAVAATAANATTAQKSRREPSKGSAIAPTPTCLPDGTRDFMKQHPLRNCKNHQKRNKYKASLNS
jgi:hypothetical protein